MDLIEAVFVKQNNSLIVKGFESVLMHNTIKMGYCGNPLIIQTGLKIETCPRIRFNQKQLPLVKLKKKK